MNLIALAEAGWLPDSTVRWGIRRLLSKRLKSLGRKSASQLLEELRSSDVAVNTSDANEQHYEVPAEFFRIVLGDRLKYSCCHYADVGNDLETAEEDMLRLTCQRAQLEDGMDILELGCGWGSLTLWMAEQYPNSRITAVSNSHGQRQFIEQRCRELGLHNAKIVTADMRDFGTHEQFDRVVSVEMFEHMRNYQTLLRRISKWLRPSGKLFVHIFCHRRHSYLFETEGAANWMGRHFFTGGIMPSSDLLMHFQDDVGIEDRWRVNGMHYAHTCEAWLRRLDANRPEVTALFEQALSKRAASVAVQRWRMFFMACAELFRYNSGTEWYVGHYLFQNKRALDQIDELDHQIELQQNEFAAPVNNSFA